MITEGVVVDCIMEGVRRTLKRLNKDRRIPGTGGGMSPFGTRRVRGKLVPRTNEIRAILHAKELRKENLTYWQISSKLADLGLVTRRGKPYSPAGVMRLLER